MCASRSLAISVSFAAVKGSTALPLVLNTMQGFKALVYPNACGADGFHKQRKAVSAQMICAGMKPVVFLTCQFPAGLPKKLPLNFQKLHPAVFPAQKPEQTIQCCQHGVDGYRGIAQVLQMALPLGRRLFGDRPSLQPAGKRLCVLLILFNGSGTALFCQQISFI